MTYPTSPLFEALGKPIKDQYGRTIGTVASFVVSPNDVITELFIEHGDKEIFRYISDQIKLDENGVTLLSPTKLKVESLCNEIPLIWRKNQALNVLVEKKKITPEMANELHVVFETTLNQLKTDAKAVSEDIDKQIAACSKQIIDLGIALVNLEIEHEIGQVSETAYEATFSLIQENRKCLSAEKEDLEAMKNKLTNILLGENLAPVALPPVPEEQNLPEEAEATSSPLPEPPVVVYVKNVNTRSDSE